MSRTCPECVQDKHGNCLGDAWDNEADEPCACACWARGHDAAQCLEPMADGSSIECTKAIGHDWPPDPTLHHDENTGLSWGPLSAVDAIVEP